MPDDVPTATANRPRRRVLLHESVHDWLHAPDSDPQLTQRARLLLWQFFANGTPTQVKPVRGVARGWLRSDLGGNHGHHFYLWWARAGSPPVKHLGLARDEVLLRAVRHHDETDLTLDPGTRDAWLPVEAPELRELKLEPAPSPQQRAVLDARARVSLLKGPPGTGKSTALAAAALQRTDAPTLYLTDNDRLAEHAQTYFREFAPDRGDLRVMTVRAFVRALADAWNVDPSPATTGDLRAQVDALTTAVAACKQRLAPWDTHAVSLHAELHAHVVGAALPFAFRGVEGCGETEVFRERSYLARRGTMIGSRAAEAAVTAAKHLLREGSLDRIAPGPRRARKALDALCAGATLPTIFADVGAVFVDEVQDLTLVELALLVQVVAAMGRARGAPTEVCFAGDEGQTVLPTDFDWGELADLCTAYLEAPQQHELTANVRSPQSLVAVVNATADLYHKLARDQRPRGRASADPDEVVSGRVIRCAVHSDDERSRLLCAIDELPRAAVVHAGVLRADHGTALPVETLGSDGAKGLDFTVVAVLGAARHLDAAGNLAARGSTDPFHRARARTMIDELRVAVSRASDTLVFVDDADGPGTGALTELLRPAEDRDGHLGQMPVDEVIALLHSDHDDAESLVQAYLTDVEAFIAENTRRALDRARHARGLLGRADTRAGVADTTLRKAVYAALGEAALRLATHHHTPANERSGLLGEANRALHSAERPTLARAALALRDLGDSAAKATTAATVLLPTLDDGALPLWWTALARDALSRWCASHTSPDAAAPTEAALAILADVVERLRRDGLAHDDALEAARARGAEALYTQGRFAAALRVIDASETPSRELRAQCLEALQRIDEAAVAYERAGLLHDALRCARRVPDSALALRLAETLGDDSAPLLRALRDAERAFEALAPYAAGLTADEMRAFKQRAQHIHGGRSSRPTP